MFLRSLLLSALFSTAVHANTEKAIFLGPRAVDVPSAVAAAAGASADPTSEAAALEGDLRRIHVLTPDDPQVRTHLGAQFPSTSYPRGKPTWLALAGLAEGRRYEVRVCWVATQPTAFKLDIFELAAVLGSPVMMADLSVYSLPRMPGAVGEVRDWPQARKLTDDATDDEAEHESGEGSPSSALFLRILATADYYTTNQTLMAHVPPVYVDIILDPFILNVLPRSLAPTVAYIVVVAAISWPIARRIAAALTDIAAGPDQNKKKDQ